jgi:histidine ammonia-lyase
MPATEPVLADAAAEADQIADEIVVGPAGITADDVLAVARRDARVRLAAAALDAMAASRSVVDDLAAAPTPAYGISTGFGALATRHISPDLRAKLQLSLIRSHAAGAGQPVEREVVRALMFLRLKTLASGRTGIRPVVAETLAAVLNAGITPVVPEHGSLGCSGDLAPLAHCALVLTGEGEADTRSGERLPGGIALDRAGITPVRLEAKEGLALINGTDGMLGMLIMACADLAALCTAADVIAAMSVEALLGTDQVFLPELHLPLRPHPGQAASADNMLRVLASSQIVASHRDGDTRVQDAYSLRCAPQVTGAVRDTIAHAETVAARELAAAIDNPVVLPDGRVTSNGNFHGAPVAYVLDFLAIAAADLGSIAERRTDRLLDPARSSGLPPFLADDPGVDSGLMIAQYTQAAMVAENKRLAAPASVDSIPSSAMQEDHVSMGWGAARKLRSALANLRRILAIELVVAARGIDLRAPLRPAPATAAAVAELRTTVPGPGSDRFLAPELAAAEDLLRGGRLAAAVSAVAGDLRLRAGIPTCPLRHAGSATLPSATSVDQGPRRRNQVGVAAGGRAVGQHEGVLQADAGLQPLEDRDVEHRPRRRALAVQQHRDALGIAAERGHQAPGRGDGLVRRQVLGDLEQYPDVVDAARPKLPGRHRPGVPQAGLHAHAYAEQRLGEFRRPRLVPVHRREVGPHGPAAHEFDPFRGSRRGRGSGREPHRHAGHDGPYSLEHRRHHVRLERVVPGRILGMDVQRVGARGHGRRGVGRDRGRHHRQRRMLRRLPWPVEARLQKPAHGSPSPPRPAPPRYAAARWNASATARRSSTPAACLR